MSDANREPAASQAEAKPPALADRPSLLWGLSSGVHSGLLTLRDESWDAGYWSRLAAEFEAEATTQAETQGEEALAAELRCEAGRILIQRLGDPERGRQLVQASGAAVAEVLLEGLPDDEDTVASQLERLRTEAADEQRPLSTRTSALVELGLSCLYDLDNPTRALAAFDAALDLDPAHPVALALSSDLSKIYGSDVDAATRTRRRRDATESPSVLAVCSLDLADATDDPDHRIEHLKTAHRALPGDQTPLRRLIRASSVSGRGDELSDLHLRLAELASDPISRATALHLALQSAIDRPDVMQTLVPRVVEAFEEEPVHALAPMCEIATALERELSREESAPWSHDAGIARTTLDTLDDPRERAVLLKLIWSRRVGRQPGEARDAALTALSSDDADVLEQDLIRCIQHLPEDEWARGLLESLYTVQREHGKLIPLLEEWSRMQTSGRGRARVLLRLGAAHEQLGGDLSRASEVYAQAAAEDRNDTSCLRALGRSYEALRRWQSAAEAYLAQAAEADDQHERLVTLRRVAELAQRELSDPEIAISALQQIVRAAEDDLLSLYQLVALSRLHRRTAVLHESLQLLVERTSAGEARGTALVELGEVLEHGLQRRTEAKSAYARALDASPGYTPALQALARLYRETGDFEALLTLYDPAVDPVTDPAVLALKAARVCLEEFGDTGRAIMYAQQAYEVNPELAPAVATLERLLRSEGRLDACYDLLRAQPRSEVAILDAHHAYELGLIAEARARAATNDTERMRLHEDALQYHRSALQHQPSHAFAWERGRRILAEVADLTNLAAHHDARAAETSGAELGVNLVAQARVLSLGPETVSEARSCYEQALQHLPDDPIVAREYATLLRYVGDRESLPSLYLGAAETHPERAMGAAMLVEAAERLVESSESEDLALAAEAVTRALSRDPGNPFAVRHLERMLLTPEHVPDLPQAVSVRAVRAQNDLERAIFYLESAELLERSGDTAQARRAYRASLAAVPGNLPGELGLARTSERRDGPPPIRRPVSAPAARASVHALVNEAKQRTNAALNSGSPEAAAQALKLLQQVLQRDGSHRDAFRLLERIIGSLDEPSPAVEVLREFFWSLSDADLRHDLGILLSTYARDTDERVRALRAATDARPGNKDGLERLVQAYRDAGDDESAAVVTESLLGLYPPGDATAFELRLGLARHLLESEGSQERALPHAEQLVAQSPKNSRGVTLLAEVLETLGRPLEAEVQLRKLASIHRDPSELRTLHIRRARLLARSRSHTRAAIDATRRAFEIDPSNRESSQILIKLHERLEDMSGLQEFFEPARAAMLRKFAMGDVSTRDLQILTHMAKATNRALGYTIQGVLHAVDANFTAPPEQHFRPVEPEGLDRVRSPEVLPSLLFRSESFALTRLLAALEPVMERLREPFPKLDPKGSTPLPFNVKPAVLTPFLSQWCPSVGLAPVQVSSCSASNLVTVLPGKQPRLQIGENLWMQGQEHDWRGLSAVALARYALGGAQTRALDPIEFDLMLAAAFESVSVFNAITADPDPQRLKELTTRLQRALPRKARRVLEQCCHQLSGENFTPSQTVEFTTIGDLRLAYIISGDISGTLGAACLLDGVSGPDLKSRLQKSRTGQQLLIDLVSDPITRCRTIALGTDDET